MPGRKLRLSEEEENCCVDIKKIRVVRVKLKMSIKRLAEISNIPYITVHRMISISSYGGDPRYIIRIAKALGIKNYKDIMLDFENTIEDNTTITD